MGNWDPDQPCMWVTEEGVRCTRIYDTIVAGIPMCITHAKEAIREVIPQLRME